MTLFGCWILWVYKSYFNVRFDLRLEVELFGCVFTHNLVFLYFVVGMSDRNIRCSQNIDQELSHTDGIDSNCWFGSDLGLEFPLEGEGCFEGSEDGPIWRKLDLIDDGIILELFAAADIMLGFLSSSVNLLVNQTSSLESFEITSSLCLTISSNICGIGSCRNSFFSFGFLVLVLSVRLFPVNGLEPFEIEFANVAVYELRAKLRNSDACISWILLPCVH